VIVDGLRARKSGVSGELSSGGEIATSVRLFHWGWNDFRPTTETFVSRNIARVVLARQGSRLVSFDLEHEPGGGSYGHGKLAMHQDGLYVDEIKWTPAGLAEIKSKRTIYVSPAYWESANRWLYSLVNVALTATPATVFARQLIAASAKGKNEMTPEEFIALMRTQFGIAPDAALEEIAKAVTDALEMAAKNAGPVDASAADEEKKEAPTGYTVAGAGGMVLASLLSMHSIDEKSPKALTDLLAKSAKLLGSADVGERLARIEASQTHSSAAARGEAKLAAFNGTSIRQFASLAAPTVAAAAEGARSARLLAAGAKAGLSPEKMAQFAGVSGFTRPIGKAV